MIHRMLHYNLSQEEMNKEEIIIKQIAQNNGYKINLIDTLIRQMKQNRTYNKKEDQKYVSIQYTDKNTETIGKVLKKYHYEPAYKVKKIKFNNTQKKEKSKAESKGVYKITCNTEDNTCGKMYIGYTDRNFLTRFKEHNSRNHQNPSSIVAKHLKENPTHQINFQNSFDVLKYTTNKDIAQIHEKFHIYKHTTEFGSQSLLNIHEDFRNNINFHIYNTLFK